MSRHVIRLIKAIRILGVINGCLVYAYYLYYRLNSRRKWTCREMRVRHVSRRIWLRPGVSDWIAMERIFLDQEYDPVSQGHDQAMNRLQARIVAEGKTPLIIDCGANIGLSSIWLSERFRDAIVASLEPEPANFRILSLNATHFPNIRPLQAGISDRASRVALSNAGNTPWAWRTQECPTGSVATVTIPHVIGLNADCRLLAVKVDIEGFEVSLFRDGAAWVDDVPLLVFEMHDWMLPWSGSGHAFFANLSRQKRDYLIRGENIFAYSHRALAETRSC